MYALKNKKFFGFNCVSETEEQFEKSINKAYWAWKGMQPIGSDRSIEEFLKPFDKVIVNIKPYNTN